MLINLEENVDIVLHNYCDKIKSTPETVINEILKEYFRKEIRALPK